MDDNTKKVKSNSVDKIEWLGMDGALVAIYFIVCAIIWFAIVNKVDVLVGYIIPGGLIIAVTVIFIRYLLEVFKFAKDAVK